jgi:hypothetical protein
LFTTATWGGIVYVPPSGSLTATPPELEPELDPELDPEPELELATPPSVPPMRSCPRHATIALATIAETIASLSRMGSPLLADPMAVLGRVDHGFA